MNTSRRGTIPEEEKQSGKTRQAHTWLQSTISTADVSECSELWCEYMSTDHTEPELQQNGLPSNSITETRSVRALLWVEGKDAARAERGTHLELLQ